MLPQLTKLTPVSRIPAWNDQLGCPLVAQSGCAKTLGVTVPPALLATADEVIE